MDRQAKAADRVMLNYCLVLVALTVYGQSLDTLLPWLHAKLLDDAMLMGLLGIGVLKGLAGSAHLSCSSTQSSIGRFLLGFALVCLFSGLINGVSVDVWSVQMRSYLLSFAMLFALGSTRLSEADVGRALRGLLLIALPVYLGVIWEMLSGRLILTTTNRFGEQLEFLDGFRTQSLIGNPIDLGIYGLSTIAILLALILTGSGRRMGIGSKFANGMLLLALFAVFSSGSRGPMLAGMVGTGMLFWAGQIRIKRSARIMVMGIMVLIPFGGVLFKRLTQINASFFAEDTYRTSFLLKSAEVIGDNPIWGVGPGRFGGWVSINYRESPLYAEYGFDTMGISSIDMFWPHLLAETGVLGALLYCLMFAALVWPAWRLLKSMSILQRPALRTLAICVLFFVPAMAVTGLVSISLESQVVLAQVAFLVGILTGHAANPDPARSRVQLAH